MSNKRLTAISKLLSFILRHKPESHGITLNNEGWADLTLLLVSLSKSKYAATLEEVKQVVKDDEKGRYQLELSNNRIRAVQGHSTTTVNRKMPQVVPPIQLYHGTGSQNKAAITTQGLIKGNRHYVHLSTNLTTATVVGTRHGNPIVFVVEAKHMHNDGYKFFQAENGVWLTESVPSKYLHLMK